MKGYYLHDDESENYTVGRIFREAGHMQPEIEALEVGQTFWGNRFHYERFQ